MDLLRVSQANAPTMEAIEKTAPDKAASRGSLRDEIGLVRLCEHRP